jgi:hypothetical protein
MLRVIAINLYESCVSHNYLTLEVICKRIIIIKLFMFLFSFMC